MGLFNAIMDKIFHHPLAQKAEQAAAQAASQAASQFMGQAQATVAPQAAAAAPQAAPSPAQQAPAQATPIQATPIQATPAQQTAQTPARPVDVEAVLSQIAAQKGGGGNWRTSIVDLLKLLDLDSSLQARKQLAQELNVHAGADGSAEENIALHKAVMTRLAENGGKVPESMKA